jgi:hypothetical protein
MTFPSIRVEGAILSGELLGKLDAGDFSGQRPADFGFDSPARLKDEIVRAWTAAQAFYTAFQHKLASVKEGAPATSETRNQWLIPLLGLLGYSELEFQPQSELVGDKPFRLSHHLRSHGGFRVHMVGARESLDKKPVAGTGPRVSPHAHLQEYLNLTEHLYGIVTNGKLLRLLRDSTRLIKLSYVEFDLDRMFSEELFADFAVLYRLLHVTRLPRSPEKSAESLLERYHQDALESGARIRDGLSVAVEQVIQELGSGFLARNESLQAAVANNSVTARDLHYALLRLIYRLLFMMVAEERGLLFSDAATPRQRKLYLDHYSISRLRRLAERRALVDPTKHDLWRGLRSTFRLFETDGPGAPLGLTGLGGQLFSAAALGPLQSAELDNGTLLSALAKLSLFRQQDTGQLSRVNYGALATEEFGSVYERLLELHPVIHPAANTLPPHFAFKQAAGNERKTSGSYYTPSSLVECLLDSALDPVLEDRLKNFAKLGYQSADAAVLALKVCDPACGSGHFLIAAAQRIARRLAVLRAGDEEPSLELLRHTLREVISHCIYGVDINPMSVELCKVGLWLEAMEAGKPLSFLDHHIRCGNSLLGATPALIAAGIPDDAFTAIEGDDKKVCAALKKLNARERAGFGELFALEDSATSERLQQAAVAVENLPDDSVRAVEQKSAAFEQLQHNYDFDKATDLANLWCAAFVIRKRMVGDLPSAIGNSPPASQPTTLPDAQPSATQAGLFGETFQQTAGKPKTPAKATAQPSGLAEAIGITSGHLRDLARGAGLADGLMQEARQLAGQYRVFHWHLAFPEVFRRSPSPPTQRSEVGGEGRGEVSGFDVILGNPPWERAQFEERAFFGERYPQIFQERSQARRRAMIMELATSDEKLFLEWQQMGRQAEAEAHFLRASGRLPLSAVDKFNLYAVFTELAARIYGSQGAVGFIVKAGLVTDSLCAKLFSSLMENRQLSQVFEFENRANLFPAVDSRERFALVTLRHDVGAAVFTFDNHTMEDVADTQRHIRLSAADLLRLSPNSKNCPKFQDAEEYRITRLCYDRFKALKLHAPPENPWGLSIDRYINVSDFSDEIVFGPDLGSSSPSTFLLGYSFAPLYEGKLFHQFDHRYASYGFTGHEPSTSEVTDKSPSSSIRFYRFIPTETAIRRNPRLTSSTGILALRDITNRTNERGLIAAILPSNITDYTVRVLPIGNSSDTSQLVLLGLLNSFLLDYLARQRIGGTHLSNDVLEQLPIPRLQEIDPRLSAFIVPRCLELTYTAWDLEAFAQDCGWSGPPFRWDEERRFQLRCELDAAFFHLYGLNRDDTAYILDTFPIVKRKDEEKHGHYRTKDRILALYDALAECQRTGQPFVSSLIPPPADPRCCHPPRGTNPPA